MSETAKDYKTLYARAVRMLRHQARVILALRQELSSAKLMELGALLTDCRYECGPTTAESTVEEARGYAEG